MGASLVRPVTDGVRSRGIRSLSLRAQLAFVIGLLSFIPNLVMFLAAVLPAYRRAGEGIGDLGIVSLWMLGVVAVSAAMGYLLSGMLLAPLLRLTRELGDLRSARGTGSGSVRLAASRLEPDTDQAAEITALTDAFNGLLAEVEKEQSRRGAFLAALMHDLKTPLVASTNLLGVVRDDSSLSREQRVAVVARIGLELTSLIDLVQKLVDAHRLEGLEPQLRREPVDVRELVETIVARLETLIAERGLSVTVEGEANATVDRRELERALYNLVSNAVRYARSHIHIDLFEGLVRLTDDGPGLGAPLEDLAQPFNDQGAAIAGRRYAAGSGGLGLFIARRVLEAHGGRLVAEGSSDDGTSLLAYLGPPQ